MRGGSGDRGDYGENDDDDDNEDEGGCRNFRDDDGVGGDVVEGNRHLEHINYMITLRLGESEG